MVIKPPYLKKGDTIGMVCPAGSMPLEKTTNCVSTLEHWGFNVLIGSTVGSCHHYFSGTDEERLADLQSMLSNENVKAVLCARGGYGLSRIIDQLNFSGYKKNPKWIIGFSDVTVLLAHIYSNFNIAALHGPMAAAFNEPDNRNLQTLHHALTGIKNDYRIGPHPFNQPGKAMAPLVGGNLTIIAHLLNTASCYHFKNKILFLEDVGEYIYNIDRMFVQLKRIGILNQISGLIIGGFTDMKDTSIPFGCSVSEAIHQHTCCLKIPVCFNFPVSHGVENVALIVGHTYKLDVTEKAVYLTE